LKTLPGLPGLKPKFASLRPGQSIETITLEEALELFKLPRTLPDYKGKEVLIGVGRFGHYVKHGEAFISMPRGEDPLELSEERAHEIIEAKLHEDRPIAMYKDKPVTKGKGRFGPFIKWEGTFVNIPKKYDPDHITEKELIPLLEAKLEKEANRYIQQWDKEKISLENGRWGPFIRKGKKAINLPKVDGERITKEIAAQLTLDEVKEIIEGGMPDSVKKKIVGEKVPEGVKKKMIEEGMPESVKKIVKKTAKK